MGHFHLKHDHDPDDLNDLTLDAGDATTPQVRRSFGYPDGITFFEEAPAGLLAHEAVTVLESACAKHERTVQEVMSGQPWVSYETTREAYLTAALIFGRADLLAAVLLDCSNQGAEWSRFFAFGEVHRTLGNPALNVLIDSTPADVLNTVLTTHLTGDLRRVPVWVAVLLAARVGPRRYGCVLRRLALSGAKGFRQHLAGKHPVLLNRAALDLAIERAEDTVEEVARKAAARRAKQHADATLSTLRQARDALADVESRTKDRDVSDILAIINELPGVGPLASLDEPNDNGPVDATDRYMAEVEERENAARSTTEHRPADSLSARFDAWGWSAVLTTSQEQHERKRLGLPPRPLVENEHRRRLQETELVTACRTKRIADVQRLLNLGVDPDTLTFMPGAALSWALSTSERLATMLLAQGANPTQRCNGVTPLSYVCRMAYERTTGGFEDREDMEDSLDPYVLRIGLLVRAGATASQLNAPTNAMDDAGPDAWHWIRKVPALYDAYLDAVEQRKQIVEEAEQGLASVRQAVKDHTAEMEQAMHDAAAMLDEAKRTAAGQK